MTDNELRNQIYNFYTLSAKIDIKYIWLVRFDWVFVTNLLALTSFRNEHYFKTSSFLKETLAQL